MTDAVLPANGYRTENEMQTQAGWHCLQIICVVTDSAKNVFEQKAYINTGVPAREPAPKIDEALIASCGDKLKASMEWEVSDATRAVEAAEKQEQITALTAEMWKIVNKQFDNVVGVRED